MTGVRLALICIGVLASFGVRAHSGSASYIHIDESAATPTIAIAVDLRDVEYAVGLDANADRTITWGELSNREAKLAGYLAARVVFSRGDVACEVSFADLQVDDIDGGAYAVMSGAASCPRGGASAMQSNLLFDLDAEHRSLVEWRRGALQSLAVLSNAQRSIRAPDQNIGLLERLAAFANEGMWHIWTGFDHLAFLLVLLLPATTARARESRGFDWRKLVAIVTSFTLAHSITLALAVTDVVSLPERPVEIAIAVSVIVAALTNLWSRAPAIGVPTAFCFGLLHGFGFASALRGLDAAPESFAPALVGFNLGVEAGQLIVVAAALPLLLIVRRSAIYASRLVPAMSLAVAVLGAVWVWERTLS